MSVLQTLIAVTSTLFVKIPWAHTRVHVKLVMGEMETHVRKVERVSMFPNLDGSLLNFRASYG